MSEREGLTLRVEDAGAGHTVIELAKRGGRYVVRPRHPLNPLLAGYRGTPVYAADANIPLQEYSFRSSSRATPRSGPPSRGSSTSTRRPGELRFRLRGRGPGPHGLQRPLARAPCPCCSPMRRRARPPTPPTAPSGCGARPGRHRHAGLQPGRQPALRLHRPRDLPAAAGGEPPAGRRRSRRADPLRTSGPAMSTSPDSPRPVLRPGPRPADHRTRRRRQPPGRLARHPNGPGRGAQAGPAPRGGPGRGKRRLPCRHVQRRSASGGRRRAAGGCRRTAQRPAARRLLRARYALHRADPGGGHGLYGAVPHLHPAREPGLRHRRPGRLARGRLDQHRRRRRRRTRNGQRGPPGAGGRGRHRGGPPALGQLGGRCGDPRCLHRALPGRGQAPLRRF